MLVGIGSGYHLQQLFKHSDSDTLIWLVEPETALMKAAFHAQDFRGLIQSKRVRWLVGMNPKQIIEQLFQGTDSNRIRARGIQMAVYQPVSSFYQNFIQALSHEVSQAIQFDSLKFNTEEVQGKELLRNSIDNLPAIVQGFSVSHLQSKTAGLPAWVIAPGPSLEQEIDDIRTNQDHAAIIAVDSAIRTLYKNGIQADIIVSIDFTELNIRHFDGFDDTSAILAAFVGIRSEITDQFINRTYFSLHSANRMIQSIPTLSNLGFIEAAGSTAHAAYLLARHLGCSPIVLVGNDLSFPNQKWYSAGTMQLELEQKDRESEPILEVESNSGCMVQTNALYKIYLDEMGKIIHRSGGNVLNTSYSGARN